MGTKLIQFIALILLLLVSGLFWGTWFSLSQSIQNFSADEFIHIGKTIIANVAFPMRLILPCCILCMLISAWWYPAKKTIGFYFGIGSILLILMSLLITLIVEVPIDNQIKLWTPSNLPADWQDIRAKWQFFHGLRTITSIASFACFAIMTIFYASESSVASRSTLARL